MTKVKSVEFIGYEDVYNMEVKDHHNYSVDGGLIIHNCDAIRYYVAGRPYPTSLPAPKKKLKLIDKLNKNKKTSVDRW